jgi:hypothetical protein
MIIRRNPRVSIVLFYSVMSMLTGKINTKRERCIRMIDDLRKYNVILVDQSRTNSIISINTSKGTSYIEQNSNPSIN